MIPQAEPLTERLFDHVLFSSHTKVRLTDGREYTVSAVDFERREVMYYNRNDCPVWVSYKRIAAVV
ncbi:hypothetical protein BHU09_10585 [Tannerella sp. oral taxon 808]|nr:hypothetical protein BHU09_10585 [Tannerella sp. oral taxon 808]